MVNSEDLFFHRELSWIEFNERVLREAFDQQNPLLERLKFLGITSSNFDEFFMVRLASLREDDPILRKSYEKAFELIHQQDQHFDTVIMPALEENKIRRVKPQMLDQKQGEFVANLFEREIHSLLTPIAMRPGNPVPTLVNLSLYLIVQLSPQENDQALHYAVVETPKNYPRIIFLPSSEGKIEFILLEDIVASFCEKIFEGYRVLEKGFFRISRAAEMTLDDEQDADLAKVMSDALRMRKMNYIVRLEVLSPDILTHFLKNEFNIPDFKVYQTQSWIDLRSVSQLAVQPGLVHLKRETWIPKPSPQFEKAEDVWSLIRDRDILIHHPYESFDAVIRFLSEAAKDPDVLAIKQTLYRAAKPSRIIDLLEQAADQGKQVTVLIELKARFDEERNIEWARRLVNAGANVIYGVAGLKIHAKACLVVRREHDGIRRYAHLATGNYNEKTAHLYSDLGFFTSSEEITRDLASFFNVMTGYSQPPGYAKIAVSPGGMRKKLEKLILREIARSESGEKGFIMAKFNSLVDRDIIQLLYQASQKGVRIQLNVRGVCCLRPGVSGLSENIEVISIVDMFLEHSRIFYFYNGGEEEVYLASADWMPRNLDRRLELMFPIEAGELKENLKEILGFYFKDNVKSWQLEPSGHYVKRSSLKNKSPFRAQEQLCERATKDYARMKQSSPDRLKPKRPKHRSLGLPTLPKPFEKEGHARQVRVLPPIQRKE